MKLFPKETSKKLTILSIVILICYVVLWELLFLTCRPVYKYSEPCYPNCYCTIGDYFPLPKCDCSAVFQTGGYYYPEEGEHFQFEVQSFREGDIPVAGVELTFQDVSEETVETGVTILISEEYEDDVYTIANASFDTIVGREYLITAEFNKSKRYVRCTVGRKKGKKTFVHSLYVVISNENTIEALYCIPNVG